MISAKMMDFGQGFAQAQCEVYSKDDLVLSNIGGECYVAVGLSYFWSGAYAEADDGDIELVSFKNKVAARRYIEKHFDRWLTDERPFFILASL